MVQLNNYKQALEIINEKEKKIANQDDISLEDLSKMINFLQVVLLELKNKIQEKGFDSVRQEILFFKTIKPKILGKLIYYNKIFKYQINAPAHCELKQKFFNKILKQLHLDFKKYHYQNEFYIYYKTQREDRDQEFFTLGKINILSGINSYGFEIDRDFSTYYDYKIAHIISHELLLEYIERKLSKIDNLNHNQLYKTTTYNWSESQNALIELIYALSVSGSINNGELEIRKIALVFEQIFDISIIDIHHSFHRMKTRSKSRTIYLDKLKASLERYMDRYI
ncbi:RteC domain-containing protein [Myroides injenensis]|uniref:RteC domain-containing protein n=1 Tax=Myroides injenensis TaxID=1183151 RepID=UPI00226EE893|nr:RteC domain-containing protein [Myroides injenensis]